MPLLAVALTVAGVSSALAQAPASSPSPAAEALHWEQREAEVTLAVGDAETVAHYHFQNVSTQPVTIRYVVTSCSCLTAKTDKQVYAPQEKGEVSVTFHPLPNQSSSTKGTVLVQTDASVHARDELQLKATILPPPANVLEPEQLSWTADEPLASKTIRLRVPVGAPAVKNVEVKSTDPKVVAAAQVKTVQLGQEYQISVTPAAGVQTTAQAKLIVRTEYVSGRSSTALVLVQVR